MLLRSSRASAMSTVRMRPLRSRSARTMRETGTPASTSPRNTALASGTCVAPTPEISTRNWASAGTVVASRPLAMSARRPRSTRGFKTVGGGG